MKRYYKLLISTSLRSGRRIDGRGEETSGDLLIGYLDIDRHTLFVERQVDVPRSPHRPGRNSVRGVARFGDGFAVCNNSEVFLFDAELETIRRRHSERRFGDIHSIVVHDDVLYVTATASDSILGFDRQLGRVFDWWAGSEPELLSFMKPGLEQALIGNHDFRPRGPYWDRFHINHLCFDSGGAMIVNLPDLDVERGRSKFWDVTHRRFHLLESSERNPIQGRIHDGVILDGHHYVGRTQSGELLKLCIADGRLVHSVDCSVPLGVTTGNPVAKEHGWLRGLTHLDDEVFLVGQSKLTLFLADMSRGTRTAPLRLNGIEGDHDNPGLAIYCMQKIDAF